MKRIITTDFRVGNSVLFLWNHRPYLGTVMMIQKDEYIIQLTHRFQIYITDPEGLPRLKERGQNLAGDPVDVIWYYIPKELCIHTGEICDFLNQPSLFASYFLQNKYNSIEEAYTYLPKYSLEHHLPTSFPWRRIPIDELIIEMSSGKSFFYRSDSTYAKNGEILEAEDGEIGKPMWKNYIVPRDVVNNKELVPYTEDNIKRIYRIGTRVPGMTVWDMFRLGKCDLIYDIDHQPQKNSKVYGLKTDTVICDEMVFDKSDLKL